MALVRKSRADIRTRSAQMRAADKARAEAMADAEITQAAESDPDNPLLTEAEFQRMDLIRAVRAARTATGLSQARFAARFRINLARLRDWEQGRSKPDSVAVAYLKVIAVNASAVEQALAG